MDNGAPSGVRVFLVDDHPVMRNGLSLLLTQSGHNVCGVAGSRAELLARLDGAQAAVALVDLSLAEESGLDLIDDLTARGVPTLIYSMHEDSKSIERAFARGARGYVTKREVEDVLLAAIAAVAAGQRYVSPEVMRSLAGRVLASEHDAEAALSQREEQILDRLGRGETSAEMSRALNISFHTVETYYGRLLRKLGLASMKELRKFAIRRHG
ncbi:response regulator transcription factor [Desulfolutivibrio sulfoxidireducens]|uniref:response regulator transcription factor n=1 Tax=Desulfolutivibrio sulfoxidireducens TaxID=2773299 RepID=UPI00159E9B54|nr:response regulator transcription factor [Desulfolutivibrio sulfoxidireducens]QLA15564.1 response regulator [Desulfolutivibrio sulfoxidireducens]